MNFIAYTKNSSSERSNKILQLFFSTMVIIIVTVFSMILCSKCKKKKDKDKPTTSNKSLELSTVTKTTKSTELQQIDEVNPIQQHAENKPENSPFPLQTSKESVNAAQIQPIDKSPAPKSDPIAVTKLNRLVVEKENTVQKVDNVGFTSTRVIEKTAPKLVVKLKRETSLMRQNKSPVFPPNSAKSINLQPSSLPESKPTSATDNIIQTQQTSPTNTKVAKTSPNLLKTSPMLTRVETQYISPNKVPEVALKNIDAQIVPKVEKDIVLDANEEHVTTETPKAVKEHESPKIAKEPEFQPEHTYYGVQLHMDME